jgi:hypothetical protein
MLYPAFAKVVTNVISPALKGRSEIVHAVEGNTVKVIAETNDGRYIARHSNSELYPPVSVYTEAELQFGQ